MFLPINKRKPLYPGFDLAWMLRFDDYRVGTGQLATTRPGNSRTSITLKSQGSEEARSPPAGNCNRTRCAHLARRADCWPEAKSDGPAHTDSRVAIRFAALLPGTRRVRPHTLCVFSAFAEKRPSCTRTKNRNRLEWS